LRSTKRVRKLPGSLGNCGTVQLCWNSVWPSAPLSTEQSKQIDIIKGSGQHLLALINEVLDISKIESVQTVIVNTPFDLFESIQKGCNCQGKIR
jgi:signal transduction histidine kinase